MEVNDELTGWLSDRLPILRRFFFAFSFSSLTSLVLDERCCCPRRARRLLPSSRRKSPLVRCFPRPPHILGVYRRGFC